MQEIIDDNAQLGERIKDRRQQLKISLRDLAELADLSPTFLSELERGLANPTLATTRRIAYALKLPLPLLLADASDDHLFVPREERQTVTFPDTHAKYEILTPHRRKMSLFEFTLPPEAGWISLQPLAEPTEECIVMLSGRLELRIAGQVRTLRSGDTLYLENRYLESYRAVGDEPAVLIAALARPD